MLLLQRPAAVPLGVRVYVLGSIKVTSARAVVMALQSHSDREPTPVSGDVVSLKSPSLSFFAETLKIQGLRQTATIHASRNGSNVHSSVSLTFFFAKKQVVHGTSFLISAFFLLSLALTSLKSLIKSIGSEFRYCTMLMY